MRQWDNETHGYTKVFRYSWALCTCTCGKHHQMVVTVRVHMYTDARFPNWMLVFHGNHATNMIITLWVDCVTCVCSNKIMGQKKLRNRTKLINPDMFYRLPSKKHVYNTQYSQAVTHPSTNWALRCLTSVIRRELVYSTWYGRRQLAAFVLCSES